MNDLITFMTHPAGMIGEIYGMSGHTVLKYIDQNLSQIDDIAVLYIDTAHLLTKLKNDALYAPECSYDKIMSLIIDADPAPDLIIVDNLYNIKDRPRPSVFFHNLSAALYQKPFNILFVNQLMHNFRYPDYSNEPFVSFNHTYFDRYAVLRLEVCRNTKNEIKTRTKRNKMVFEHSIFAI